MADPKSLAFRGSAQDDLRAFPLTAKREAGHQLDQVQNGLEPDSAGAFRVIYVAKFADAIYVLHCFQKKTAKTNQTDIDLATKRYRDLKQELEQ
jgi:phage-related protein